MSEIVLQSDALLVQAAATVTIESLNQALRASGWWLPVVPLRARRTLAELVACNAGGRYHFRYGTIARYLRGATVIPVHQGNEGTAIHLGGATLKRASGYALERALLLPGAVPTGDDSYILQDITLQIRPLPQRQAGYVWHCTSIEMMQCMAGALLGAQLDLSALAFLIDADGSVLLLSELHGMAEVVARQGKNVIQIAEKHGAIAHDIGVEIWHPWERIAAAWSNDHDATATYFDLLVPRSTIGQALTEMQKIASRYGLQLYTWGDAGSGTISLRMQAGAQKRSASEIAAARLMIVARAQQMGGAVGTEHGHPVQQTHQYVSHAPRTNHVDMWRSREWAIAQAREIVGAAHVVTRADDMLCYARDASIARAEGQPLGVVLPRTSEEVAEVIRAAAAAGIAVVTRGAGSGLAGGATPTDDALLIVLTRMQQVRVDVENAIASAEAGATTLDVQQAAAAHRLFYPPDPSSLSVSTIGGNIACNAGGPRCLKYGVTRDYVVGMTVVLADGSLVRVGDGFVGQSVDAGLLHALIGSEGTLAIITEARLRLIAPPAQVRTVLALFERLGDACTTVERVMASGLVPASLELMDAVAIGVVEEALHLGLPKNIGALLLMMADGEPEAVTWETAQMATMARDGGAQTVRVAERPEDELALWRARRSLSPALARVRPQKLGEDICVPVSQVAAAVAGIQEIAARHQLIIPVFGHAGDGNLHPNILFDGRDTEETGRVWHAAEEIFRLALTLGGTLSGEHGIGTLKRSFLALDLGPEVLLRQHSIKMSFDPQSRLNPGKVLPERVGDAGSAIP